MGSNQFNDREATLAAVSMRGSHDPEANWKRYEEFIDEAAANGVDYLVFPEVSLHGYLFGSRELGTHDLAEQHKYFRAVAETIPGPTTEKLHELARKHTMYIQAGMAEKSSDGSVVFNSAVLIGPEGIVGVFRKFHNQFEWPVFSPGNHMEVFDTGLGKVGMFICYDLAFPEITRLYALRGARIAALTTAWPMKGDDHTDDYYGYTYDILSRSNALMNQMWMVCSNQIGRPDTPGTPNYYGHSRIIAPNGTVITDIGYSEGLAIASVDLVQGIEDGRTMDFFGLNLLQDRRPTYYGDIGREKPYLSLSSDFDSANDRSDERKGVTSNGIRDTDGHVVNPTEAVVRR